MYIIGMSKKSCPVFKVKVLTTYKRARLLDHTVNILIKVDLDLKIECSDDQTTVLKNDSVNSINSIKADPLDEEFIEEQSLSFEFEHIKVG